MDFKEIDFLQKFPRGFKFLFRFPSEPHNNIRGNSWMEKILPQQPAAFFILLTGVFPVHPPQCGVAAALEGQVEMWADLGQPGQPPGKFLRYDSGLQGAKADAVNPANSMDFLD